MSELPAKHHSESGAEESWVEVVPGDRVDGMIRPPGSKSLTNRALICAAFANGVSTLRGALRSEDTEVMIEALRSIGVDVQVSEGGRTLEVDASGRNRLGADDPTVEMFIANSGTSIRFLAAALSAAGGNYRLHGVDRMHQRPIGDLVDAIESVVAGKTVAKSPEGCPPVEIESNGWKSDHVRVGGAVSSQYLSGLMMAATITSNPRNVVQVVGELVSRPYVDMTAEVMRSFGARVELIAKTDAATDSEALEVLVQGDGSYQSVDYEIEPDASAASYFWATAAITGGTIKVEGLSRDAMQGDVEFCEVLQHMGCDVEYQDDYVTVTGHPLRGVDVDMNHISDTVQTLAVVALFADGPTRVRGVAHNRFKETDRIGDLACELRKLGAAIEEHGDGLTIHPPEQPNAAKLQTYHDHRMAMSLSLAGLRIPGVRILDPACTSKTYPEFFADLEKLIGRPHRWA
ncbi:MAG: 3-phosphoshikimate 1-carboxyvinyltransferase [Rubripirellula sp.]